MGRLISVEEGDEMLIFRGVSRLYDEQRSGKILPKGTDNSLMFSAGNTIVPAGSSYIDVGKSIRNAEYAHNACSDLYPTSYVSFTTCEKTAKFFATDGNTCEGWVYCVDTVELARCGISYSEKIPGLMNDYESEVRVDLINHPQLPAELVLRKEHVYPE